MIGLYRDYSLRNDFRRPIKFTPPIILASHTFVNFCPAFMLSVVHQSDFCTTCLYSITCMPIAQFKNKIILLSCGVSIIVTITVTCIHRHSSTIRQSLNTKVIQLSSCPFWSVPTVVTVYSPWTYRKQKDSKQKHS